MITLYGAARVPYTEKVRRALLYKRLDVRAPRAHHAEDYQRWNPKSGMPPVIHVGDEVIEDSTQILYALDARYPDPPLLAPDPTVASQQRQLEDWADDVVPLVLDEVPAHARRRRDRRRRSRARRPSMPRPSKRRRAADSAACAPGLRPAAPGSADHGPAARARRAHGRPRELPRRASGSSTRIGCRWPTSACTRCCSRCVATRSRAPARLLAERPSLVAFMARVEEATERQRAG